MKISVDTNILARAVLQDDPEQGHKAVKLLEEVTLIAVSLLTALGQSARLL